MNKEINTPKRSEINNIIQKMNEEMNNQLTKQNQKVESIETILQ